MNTAVLPGQPAAGRARRRAWDPDALLQRGLLLAVIAYLVVGLLIPLIVMGSKSLQTYAFQLDAISVQMDRGQGFGPARSLEDWRAEADYTLNDGLRAGERSRDSVARIIPRGARQDVERLRFTDQSATGGLLLLDGRLSQPGQQIEVARADVGKLEVAPAQTWSLENYGYYFSNERLLSSIWNSLWVALVVVALVVPLAFCFAYGLTRTRMPGRGFFRLVALVPVLAPSLLPAIGLVYLFGKQGLLTPLLMGADIYGPLGIVIASVFFTLPHAILIMMIALSSSDQRLYEAAEVLGASKRRTFWTVTLPGARYGLISSAFVVFTLVITDFGVPKVIGGSFDMLALDIYKQVIGQQNFQIGAVVSIILLLPAILAFAVDRFISRRQSALMTAKAVPLVIKEDRQRDRTALLICGAISVFILGIIGICQVAALVKFWPYNLTPGLQNYDFGRMDGGGWGSYRNSIVMATLSACIGTFLVFVGAYLVEKVRGATALRQTLQFLSMMPMAVPGMVLGLAYIFFFNDPANPLHVLYGTMSILVLSTITHLYTVSHITSATALKQMDAEFEAVAQSLQQPFWRTFFKVNAPVCFPALAEVWLYIFVNAMTTVSAVVFLYSPETTLASVAVLNMDDAGDIAPASAMALMIFYTNAAVRIAHTFVTDRILKSQTWRVR